MKKRQLLLVTGGALLLAGCGTTRTVPGPTITKLVPGPVVTKIVKVPGPVVTVTAQPPILLDRSYSGSGSWQSPPSLLGCNSPIITVKYSYSGNGSSIGADNFIASLASGSDDQPIANDIAYSGGKTTTLYPDTSLGDLTYHLSVAATGSWSFKLIETC